MILTRSRSIDSPIHFYDPKRKLVVTFDFSYPLKENLLGGPLKKSPFISDCEDFTLFKKFSGAYLGFLSMLRGLVRIISIRKSKRRHRMSHDTSIHFYDPKRKLVAILTFHTH